MEQFANDVPTQALETTLDGAIDSSVTTITVASTADFPSPAEYRIRVDDELMLVTDDTAAPDLEVDRGIEGTTAAAHDDGATVVHLLTAEVLENFRDGLVPEWWNIDSTPGSETVEFEGEATVVEGPLNLKGASGQSDALLRVTDDSDVLLSQLGEHGRYSSNPATSAEDYTTGMVVYNTTDPLAAAPWGLYAFIDTPQVTSNTAGEATGLYFNVRVNVSSGVTVSGRQFGVSGYVELTGGGTVTGYIAAGDFLVTITGTGSHANDVRAAFLHSPGVTGTVGTAYGLYIEEQKVSGVTAGYGVYQVGVDDLNRIEGPIDLPERSGDPAAPPANTARLYSKDVGGKTAVFARFPTGAAVQIAIEP